MSQGPSVLRTLVCPLHHSLRVVGLVDDAVEGAEGTFASLPLVPNIRTVAELFDGVLITDVAAAQLAHDAMVTELGATGVLVPGLLVQAIAALRRNGGNVRLRRHARKVEWVTRLAFLGYLSEGLTEGECALILIDFLGRKVRASIDPEMLAAA